MDSDYGLVVGAGESLSNVLTTCERVAAFNHDIDDFHIETLSGLAQAIRPFQDERNAVVHARWYAADVPRHFYGTRSRRPNPKNARGLGTDLFWTTDQVLDLAKNLARATEIVEALVERMPNRDCPRVIWSRKTLTAFDSLFTPRPYREHPMQTD